MLVARLSHEAFEAEATCAVVAPINGALELRRKRLGFFHLVGEPDIAKRYANFGFAQRERDLLGAKQRHGRHHNAAGLDDGKVGRNHHRAVRAAQQHALSGNHAEIARQHIGNSVHALERSA